MSNCCGHNSEDTLVLKVNGMTCNHCKMTVEKALQALEGVSKAVAEPDKDKVTVSFDAGKINEEQIKNTIQEAGYEVTG